MTMPVKLCECGCGAAAPIAPHTNRKRGWKKDEPLRFIHGHNKERLPDDLGLVGYCACGCGRQTNNAARTSARKGERKGHPRKFVRGHRTEGKGPIYVVAESGCWVWNRTGTRGGYGMMSHGGKTRLAHRVYYEQHVGPIPEGMSLDHLCRNRACVNPAHLEPVTHTENCRRGANAKLTAEQVAAIRAHRPDAPRYGARELAAQYGVSVCTISEIRRGDSWS